MVNRQARIDAPSSEWVDYGNVTYKEAARMRVSGIDGLRFDTLDSSKGLVVLVRDEDTPEAVRRCVVRRKVTLEVDCSETQNEVKAK